jgi:hypothetical protein
MQIYILFIINLNNNPAFFLTVGINLMKRESMSLLALFKDEK